MTELKIKTQSSEEAVIIMGIHYELFKAEKKHPTWPVDNLFEQIAILSEEAGEVAKAALDFKDGKAPITELKEELMQTAAMCIRILKNLKNE